jgi:hypothetical protein
MLKHRVAHSSPPSNTHRMSQNEWRGRRARRKAYGCQNSATSFPSINRRIEVISNLRNSPEVVRLSRSILQDSRVQGRPPPNTAVWLSYRQHLDLCLPIRLHDPKCSKTMYLIPRRFTFVGRQREYKTGSTASTSAPMRKIKVQARRYHQRSAHTRTRRIMACHKVDTCTVVPHANRPTKVVRTRNLKGTGQITSRSIR